MGMPWPVARIVLCNDLQSDEAGDMTIYYSWRKTDEESIPDWKAGRLTYKYRGVPSRKAFWVFKATSRYHPRKNIATERILIAYDISAQGEPLIERPQHWIRFPGPAFHGETQHPANVIVKDNEPGAFGVGADILLRLLVKEIRLATRREVANSLDIDPEDVEFRKQRW